MGTEIREELEHHTERDMFRDVLGEFGEGWEIRPPGMRGEPWTAKPRRSGLPYVVGGTIEELRGRLAAAADAAGLVNMLAIEADFPGWSVWRASDGSWWATRKPVHTQEMQDCGLHATVGDVRRPADLRTLLAEQVALETWAAEHEWRIPGEQARRELGLPAEGQEFRFGQI